VIRLGDSGTEIVPGWRVIRADAGRESQRGKSMIGSRIQVIRLTHLERGRQQVWGLAAIDQERIEGGRALERGEAHRNLALCDTAAAVCP